jgi:membrane protein required for colicin V production
MNWLDIVIIIILALNLILGFKRGLVRSVFGIFALALGIFVGIMGASFLASLLLPIVINKNLAQILGFAIFFFSIFFLVTTLGNVIHASVKNTFFIPLNILSGGFFGIMKGIIIVLFLLIPVLRNPLISPAVAKGLEDSRLLLTGEPLVVNAAPAIEFITNHITSQWGSGNSFLKKAEFIKEQPEPSKNIIEKENLLMNILTPEKKKEETTNNSQANSLIPKSIKIDF